MRVVFEVHCHVTGVSGWDHMMRVVIEVHCRRKEGKRGSDHRIMVVIKVHSHMREESHDRGPGHSRTSEFSSGPIT